MTQQILQRVGGDAPINFKPSLTALVAVSPTFALRAAKPGDPPRPPMGFLFPPLTSPVGQKVRRALSDLND